MPRYVYRFLGFGVMPIAAWALVLVLFGWTGAVAVLVGVFAVVMTCVWHGPDYEGKPTRSRIRLSRSKSHPGPNYPA